MAMARSANIYLAHVRQDGEIFIPHDLEEHLHDVSIQLVEAGA
jgi:hypothetical protein